MRMGWPQATRAIMYTDPSKQEWHMATQASQTTQGIPEGRSLSEDEAIEVQKNLAQTNFGMSLDEFETAWKAGKFDDRNSHNKAVSLAMLVPECQDDRCVAGLLPKRSITIDSTSKDSSPASRTP